ncbi:hypothetical protein [Paenibacillus sp. 276b]|uniref:hypothetical protein n=1 Tax=Paenibacillus sp. 276b TaxID=1566277 RepID=UPI001C40ABDE|nr:hypothetical protein [Paenibacillus sp. 276b]
MASVAAEEGGIGAEGAKRPPLEWDFPLLRGNKRNPEPTETHSPIRPPKLPPRKQPFY